MYITTKLERAVEGCYIEDINKLMYQKQVI